MPTPGERKALIFLSSVIVLGGATRLYRSRTEPGPVDSASAEALRLQIARVDSATASRRSGARRPKKKVRRKGASDDPPSVPAVIDLDRAAAPEIETLRGVGPALAARIVADRDSFGAFGSAEGFQRVKGVGPALAEKLAPHVTFSGVPRPVNTVVSRRSVKKAPGRKPRRKVEGY
jgi:competence ComEA-like helix-hairpin-helix protein